MSSAFLFKAWEKVLLTPPAAGKPPGGAPRRYDFRNTRLGTSSTLTESGGRRKRLNYIETMDLIRQAQVVNDRMKTRMRARPELSEPMSGAICEEAPMVTETHTTYEPATDTYAEIICVESGYPRVYRWPAKQFEAFVADHQGHKVPQPKPN